MRTGARLVLGRVVSQLILRMRERALPPAWARVGVNLVRFGERTEGYFGALYTHGGSSDHIFERERCEHCFSEVRFIFVNTPVDFFI